MLGAAGDHTTDGRSRGPGRTGKHMQSFSVRHCEEAPRHLNSFFPSFRGAKFC